LMIFAVHENFAYPMRVEIPKGLNSLSARECGSCHEEIYKEWSQSMHSKAWKDQYYRTEFKYDGSTPVCKNCHTPLENQQKYRYTEFRDRDMLDPVLKPNPNFDPDLQNEGVTCAVCHIQNGRIVGPFGSVNAPHPVKADPEMSSGSKYCLKCHTIAGKRWDTFYKIPPCGTIAEIKADGNEPDCVGCHMPPAERPLVKGFEPRRVGRHLFHGGHHPYKVKSALSVEYEKEVEGDGVKFIFTLTNTGTYHYLPTGTPDRHLTLELRLFGQDGELIKEKIFKMKRYILWRPVIADLWDTRLPYDEPRKFVFGFSKGGTRPPRTLEISVRYHLLDEARKKKIGYETKEPISYEIFGKKLDIRRESG